MDEGVVVDGSFVGWSGSGEVVERKAYRQTIVESIYF
jgi:L-amino acid N-acyltransferase YncA